MLTRPRLVAACALIVALLATQVAGAAVRRNLFYWLPQDQVETLSFEATHSVSTAFSRLPPEAEPFDVASIEARMGHVERA